MTKHVAAAGLALAALALWKPSVSAQKTGDACSLLQATDIQMLAGTAKVGPGAPSTDPLGSQLCRYQWGTGGNVTNGRSILDVSVTPTSKAFPGMDASRMRQGLLATVKGGDPNAAVVAAVGDAAIYQSNASIRVEATALVKANVLIVTFESADARARKDLVITLMKAAAARL